LRLNPLPAVTAGLLSSVASRRSIAISLRRAMVNVGVVNGTGFSFLPASKRAIFRDFPSIPRIRKVR